MNMIWSQQAGSDVAATLAGLHHCLAPASRGSDSAAFSGLLCGAWDLRLLLLELGSDGDGPVGPWPESWFDAASGPVVAGLRLRAERWTPRDEDLDELDERFEGVGGICLWLGDRAADPASAELIVQIASRAHAMGLSVLTSGPRGAGLVLGSAGPGDLARIAEIYADGAVAKAAIKPETAAEQSALAPMKRLLSDLPSDQRFQARVAVLSALAWDLKQSGRSLDGLERRRALAVGESLLLAMAEATTAEWATETMTLLIAAVRAKNTMDTRLRNMANDRLGLLVLLATARLGLRCRSFTVREICRELGAVATGM